MERDLRFYTEAANLKLKSSDGSGTFCRKLIICQKINKTYRKDNAGMSNVKPFLILKY